MPPTLALFLWLVLLLGLLLLDPAKDSETSIALWVPVIWMFITASRLPSQWLGGHVGTAAQAFEEGNPLDRTVFSVLILLAIGILISRSFKWSEFFARNLVLTVFVFFSLLSVVWSDFAFVAFKRWFRDLGSYVVILVVLSDPRPLEAVRTLLRRLCYLLIPLSIVLIKYFPEIGRQYSAWTGDIMFVGVTTGKNMLGAVFLIGGIFFFWDTVTRWPDRKERRTKRIMMVNIAFMAMTAWLLVSTDSETSRLCLAIGCLVIVAAHAKWGRRHPAFFKVLLPTFFCLYLILAMGFNINGEVAGAVGRDPTLTDRTAIWSLVLNMHTNPVVGTGYDSFWLGPRLQTVWHVFGTLNEAHNGYLEVYLNLGLVGLILLLGLLIASYRNICRKLSPYSNIASLSLALWIITLFYNITESAFKFHLMWVILLLVGMAVPQRAEDSVRGIAAIEDASKTQHFPRLSLETTGSRG